MTTANSIKANVNQTVAFFTYGLGNRLDLSLAVPFVNVDMAVVSNAEIHRLGTASSPATHFFDDPSAPGGYGTQKQFASSGSASGIGDLVVRLKGNPVRGESFSLALGLDVRIPTGDEMNFLGLGAPGLKPFVAASFSTGRFAPHLNAAYLWNGKSVLAGNVATGQKADLPDQFLYAAGIDIGAAKRLTLAFDFLGSWVINSPRLVETTFTAATGDTFPQIGFKTGSYSIANGSAGLKFNPVGKLLVDLNVLFSLNSTGLRDKVTPLVGIEYAF